MRACNQLLGARAARSSRRCSSSFTAAPAGVAEQAETGGRAGRRTTAARISAGRPAPRSAPKLWSARHDAFWACRGAAAGRARRGRRTSACRSRGWPSASWRRGRDIEAEGLLAPIVGHVGDGNFHVTFLLDPDDPGEIGAGRRRLNDRMVERALAMGGTCTGEHGIGIGKIGLSRGRARRGGRADAADQAGARPAEHPQPGEGPSAGLIPTAQAPDSCRNPSRVLKSGKPLSSHLPAGFQPRKAKPFQRLAPQSPGPAIFAPFHPKPRAVGQG